MECPDCKSIVCFECGYCECALWISIKDRLPPKDTKVLCYYYDQYIDVMEYWYDDENGKPEFWNPPAPPINNVTHWMLLPKPPQN